jgi:DNA-binding NarL/FixJ family response regulator
MFSTRNTVLVADDNAQWRGIIATVLQPEFEVIGYVERGDELAAAALRLQPEVVTLDVSMPGQSGLNALPAIRRILPDAIVIVVTTTASAIYREEAIRRGADGYVLKSLVLRDLVPAIQRGRLDTRENERYA